MKFAHSIKNSAGIGLIEVLVATVVVAVGLLGVASLQGNLMGGSRSNKTRAECQILANTKIEQLRDSIEKTGTSGYDALASSTANESITGVTETFSRGWVVTNQTNPGRKQVSVTVNWGNGAENQCAVQSVIAFDGVGNSVLAAKGAGAAGNTISGPSTNAESSDDITETINLPTANTPATPGSVETVNGKTYIVQNTGVKGSRADLCSAYTPSLVAFENDLYTRRVDHDGVSGNEAIELFEKVVVSSFDYCIPKIRYNGGLIIPIRGIVHSGATTGNGPNQTLLDVNLFTFNTSESGTYCVFKPGANAKSAPYVCYVGGNCNHGPDGESAAVTECPVPAVSAAKVGPGGWRGKVGLLGVASNGRNACFAEEVTGSPATLDTARNYYTRRNGLNEGINKPYSCHDFLIINGQTTEAKVHNECVTQANAIGGFTLASKNIQRNISGNNVFDPVIDNTYCTVSGTSYTITGTIANANSPPTVTVSDSTSNNCSATSTSYSCQITTSANSVTISGVYNSQTVTCTLSPPSSTGCALTFTPTVNPTYTINGAISGTADAANAVALSMSNGGSCTNFNNGTYTCTITTATATTSATLTATISTGGAVTPNTAQTITLPGSTATLTGPSFSASMATTYTISGSINIGNNVSLTTVTAAVDTGAGTCTLTGNHAESSSDSYSCTVPTGANHLTIAISPACSTGGGSKKYQLTDGTTTTLGTGSLVINFSNITGNISKNISITRSNTNC